MSARNGQVRRALCTRARSTRCSLSSGPKSLLAASLVSERPSDGHWVRVPWAAGLGAKGMATFSPTPCSHLPPHGPQCRWGRRPTPAVTPFGGPLGAGCGTSFRGERSPELGRKRLTGQRWASCFGRARKCGHAMVQHPESFPVSPGECWPISQPSGAPRPGPSPRQALTAASRNRPLNASSLPDHHRCCHPPSPCSPRGPAPSPLLGLDAGAKVFQGQK